MQKASQPGEAAVEDISTLLRAWSDGDQSALARLTPIVYDEPGATLHETRAPRPQPADDGFGE